MKMWITLCVLCCLASTIFGAEDHKNTSKEDASRGKRNLSYLSHHPATTAQRRISNGPHFYQPSFHSGLPPNRSFKKGRSRSLPVPPYAVQMEPLVHYSQRDPLYDTNNKKSLQTDGHPYDQTAQVAEDLQPENNHIHHHSYYPPRAQIIEKPVYIKEPEPIIEIIIKESNVTLPPPPTLPPTPPPKKKKEQVHVFYVKYKKNPNGYGKDSIIYDKPIPAISPTVETEEEEEQEPQPQYYPEPVVTQPPPPSTTLRTIIKPESEVYHGPSGIKVTFGQEGFDYHKRQSKPEDFAKPLEDVKFKNQEISFPSFHQPRQLSFPPNSGFESHRLNGFDNRRPSASSLSPVPNFRPAASSVSSRPPQSYRPFSIPFKTHPASQFRPQPQVGPPEYSTLPKSLYQNQPAKISPQPYQPQPQPQFPPSFSSQYSTIPQFEQPRKPVPYQPFETFKNQNTKPREQIIPFRPQHHHSFGAAGQGNAPEQQQLPKFNQPLFLPNPIPNYKTIPDGPALKPQFQNFRDGPHIQQQPQPQFNVLKQQQTPSAQPHQNFQTNQFRGQQQQVKIPQQLPPQFVQQNFVQPLSQQPQHNFNQVPQDFHTNTLQQVQNILPSDGGQLVASIPRFEQHISTIEPAQNNRNHHQQHQQQQQQQQQHQQHQHQQFQKQQQQEQQQFQEQQQQEQQQFQKQQQQDQQQFHQQQQQFQQPLVAQSNIYKQTAKPQTNYRTQQFNLNSLEEQYRQANLLQESIRGNFNPEITNYSTQKEQPHSQSQSQSYRTTTQRTPNYVTTRRTTAVVSSTTSEPEKPSTTTKDPKILNAQLPDEVPDELRQQLLSSGILNNADISVLDYDKVGDIPLSALPPDQLANFFSAGGAQQIAGSEPVPQYVSKEGEQIDKSFEENDQETAASESHEVREKFKSTSSDVQMKVVHYDPLTKQGQQVQNSYVNKDAKQINPVALNDEKYNRYLPLKVSGAQFPIPEVPELKGKKIDSVVVLAPINFDYKSGRITRDAKKDYAFVQGEELRELLKNPTVENYRKFIESEAKRKSEQQSVILLVTGSDDDREIFMYDVGTRTVSKLNGTLSAAFVKAAEENDPDKSEKLDKVPDYSAKSSHQVLTNSKSNSESEENSKNRRTSQE